MSEGVAGVPEESVSRAVAPGSAAPGAVAAIGERALLAGFHLAGARIHACESEQEFLHAWTALPQDTAVVILTPRCAQALGPAVTVPGSPMTVVLPS
ncbi:MULTISPECIES: hypothetical protein [Arthrobacter]|uniref:hypothetical protein n=1 Tax=Arthrobacter TaxID=1663 RepID=UPI0007825354|nr:MULTISPECIES: hypothetical protein [Arthrobacter]